MSNIFFSGDHHFFHNNVVKYARRPFNSVEEMDAMLIQYWNETVRRDDQVYYLGDLTMSNNIKAVDSLLKSLNGRIFFIKGNHDMFLKRKCLPERFEWVKDYYELNHNKKKIVVCHYPLLTWRNAHHGSYHFHAHCHGTINEKNSRTTRIDVGVDCWDYHPVSLEELFSVLAKRTYQVVDHHSTERGEE